MDSEKEIIDVSGHEERTYHAGLNKNFKINEYKENKKKDEVTAEIEKASADIRNKTVEKTGAWQDRINDEVYEIAERHLPDKIEKLYPLSAEKFRQEFPGLAEIYIKDNEEYFSIRKYNPSSGEVTIEYNGPQKANKSGYRKEVVTVPELRRMRQTYRTKREIESEKQKSNQEEKSNNENELVRDAQFQGVYNNIVGQWRKKNNREGKNFSLTSEEIDELRKRAWNRYKNQFPDRAKYFKEKGEGFPEEGVDEARAELLGFLKEQTVEKTAPGQNNEKTVEGGNITKKYNELPKAFQNKVDPDAKKESIETLTEIKKKLQEIVDFLLHDAVFAEMRKDKDMDKFAGYQFKGEEINILDPKKPQIKVTGAMLRDFYSQQTTLADLDNLLSNLGNLSTELGQEKTKNPKRMWRAIAGEKGLRVVNRILNQDEVDALLKGLSDGELEKELEFTEQEKKSLEIYEKDAAEMIDFIRNMDYEGKYGYEKSDITAQIKIYANRYWKNLEKEMKEDGLFSEEKIGLAIKKIKEKHK